MAINWGQFRLSPHFPAGTPLSPVAGADQGYKNALIDTQIGQPSTSSFRAGTSILVSGSQF
jgi:hypothetical protein